MGMNPVARASRRVGPSHWVTEVGAILTTATLAACQGSLNELEPSTDLIDGITCRVASSAIAESFPVQIVVTVEVMNRSSTSRSVTVSLRYELGDPIIGDVQS